MTGRVRADRKAAKFRGCTTQEIHLLHNEGPALQESRSTQQDRLKKNGCISARSSELLDVETGTTLPFREWERPPKNHFTLPRRSRRSRRHGNRDGIADATRAPCGLNEDFVAPRTSVQMLVLSIDCPTYCPCCQGRDRYQLRIGRNLFAATVSKSTATAAPAPVVSYIQPSPTFQTTRHELGRHSRRVATVSGWLQLLYGALVGAAPIFQGANLSLQFVWSWCQFYRG